MLCTYSQWWNQRCYESRGQPHGDSTSPCPWGVNHRGPKAPGCTKAAPGLLGCSMLQPQYFAREPCPMTPMRQRGKGRCKDPISTQTWSHTSPHANATGTQPVPSPECPPLAVFLTLACGSWSPHVDKTQAWWSAHWRCIKSHGGFSHCPCAHPGDNRWCFK